jgi:hypothetical protein
MAVKNKSEITTQCRSNIVNLISEYKSNTDFPHGFKIKTIKRPTVSGYWNLGRVEFSKSHIDAQGKKHRISVDVKCGKVKDTWSSYKELSYNFSFGESYSKRNPLKHLKSPTGALKEVITRYNDKLGGIQRDEQQNGILRYKAEKLFEIFQWAEGYKHKFLKLTSKSYRNEIKVIFDNAPHQQTWFIKPASDISEKVRFNIHTKHSYRNVTIATYRELTHQQVRFLIGSEWVRINQLIGYKDGKVLTPMLQVGEVNTYRDNPKDNMLEMRFDLDRYDLGISSLNVQTTPSDELHKSTELAQELAKEMS